MPLHPLHAADKRVTTPGPASVSQIHSGKNHYLSQNRPSKNQNFSKTKILIGFLCLKPSSQGLAKTQSFPTTAATDLSNKSSRGRCGTCTLPRPSQSIDRRTTRITWQQQIVKINDEKPKIWKSGPKTPKKLKKKIRRNPTFFLVSRRFFWFPDEIRRNPTQGFCSYRSLQTLTILEEYPKPGFHQKTTGHLLYGPGICFFGFSEKKKYSWVSFFPFFGKEEKRYPKL